MNTKRSLGQNFLVDPNYKKKILLAVQAVSHDKILEIGPGKGALTGLLAELGVPLGVIEKDARLAPLLKNRFPDIQVIQGDFLKKELSSFLGEPGHDILVVGNLPYNAASPILIRLLKHRGYFNHLFLMFQREVARRIVAQPGTKEYGLLTVWAQAYTIPHILFDLPPSVFRPKPKIYSSFVSFSFRKKPLIDDPSAPAFFQFASLLFQHRRKTILSTLKINLGKGRISKIDFPLNPQTRGEDLPVESLVAFFRHLSC